MNIAHKKLQKIVFTTNGSATVTPEGAQAWEWQLSIKSAAAGALTLTVEYAMMTDPTKLVAWDGSPYTVPIGGSLGLLGYSVAPAVKITVAGLAGVETALVEILPHQDVNHGVNGVVTTTVV